MSPVIVAIFIIVAGIISVKMFGPNWVQIGMDIKTGIVLALILVPAILFLLGSSFAAEPPDPVATNAIVGQVINDGSKLIASMIQGAAYLAIAGSVVAAVAAISKAFKLI